MRRIPLIALCLGWAAAPAAALTLSASRPVTAVPAVRIAPSLAAPSLGACALAPVLQGVSMQLAPALAPAAPAVWDSVRPVPAELPIPQAPLSPQAAIEKLTSDGNVSAALKADAPVGQRAAALSGIFDGIPVLQAAPASGLPGAGSVQMLNGAYGFYSWLANVPELGSQQAKANALIAASPLLERGPVIAMKDAQALTVLSAQNPELAPAVIPLSKETLSVPSSPQAKILAERLDKAAARDQAEGGLYMRVAEVLAKLPAIAREQPAPKTPAPSVSRNAELPVDPVRQPREYLERMLRDAMRSSDPFEALAILRQARKEARTRLNYQEGSRYLEQLRGQAELLAGQFIPGLLEKAQLAAAQSDKAEVERLLGAALDLCEYAPGWKDKVIAAHETAHNTLEVLKRYGPMDEKTGLPVPAPEPTAPEAAP